MMTRKMLLSAMAAAVLLTGCTTDNVGTKQGVGTVGGAVVGGVLGSRLGKGSGQLWATGAGALLGAFVGNEIGSSLDKADRLEAERANNAAFSAPMNQQIAWRNPQSGNYGTVTPVREGTTPTGQYCREFQQTVVVGGQTQSAFGQACQQPDGSWRIVQ